MANKIILKKLVLAVFSGSGIVTWGIVLKPEICRSNPGPFVIKKFQSRVITLLWNNAL